MLRLILVVVVLTIIMIKPFTLFLGAAVGLAWLLFTRPNSFSWPSDKAVKEPKKEKSVPNKDFITYEERQEKELSKMKFKEGFQDDPKWKVLNKKVRDHNARQAGIPVQKDRLEELTSEVV